MRKQPNHIKRADVIVGTVLYYQDERNKGWAMVVTRILPKIAGCKGRSFTQYRIKQRHPNGVISVYGTDRSLPYLNREFKLTA